MGELTMVRLFFLIETLSFLICMKERGGENASFTTGFI
jgi:hypothetical protein